MTGTLHVQVEEMKVHFTLYNQVTSLLSFRGVCCRRMLIFQGQEYSVHRVTSLLDNPFCVCSMRINGTIQQVPVVLREDQLLLLMKVQCKRQSLCSL